MVMVYIQVKMKTQLPRPKNFPYFPLLSLYKWTHLESLISVGRLTSVQDETSLSIRYYRHKPVGCGRHTYSVGWTCTTQSNRRRP